MITHIDGKPFAFRDDLDLLEYLGRIRPGQRIRFTTIARQQRIVREVTALEMSDEHYRRWKFNVALARSAAR